jgi:hypothetical protein
LRTRTNCLSRPTRSTSWWPTTCCTTYPIGRAHSRKSGGCSSREAPFYASTIGRGHLAELAALVPGWGYGRYAEAFGLETGPEQLRSFFSDIRTERFEDGLAVTDPEPVLAYIRSSSVYHGEDLTEARTTVEQAIARHGAFAIAKRQGVISCRKP